MSLYIGKGKGMIHKCATGCIFTYIDSIAIAITQDKITFFQQTDKNGWNHSLYLNV